MVLINWNTEWATSRSRRGKIIIDLIRRRSPQIVCLTEAYLDLLPGDGYLIASEADYGYPQFPGRRKVILWSKKPWQEAAAATPAAMPSGRYVYGETQTSIGTIGVHGVCIPWSAAHVSTGLKNRRRWQDHSAYLKALPACLQQRDCARQILVGDFNQRLPLRYTPHKVHQLLLRALGTQFRIITAGSIQPINRPTVDHIALNGRLQAAAVSSISNIGPQGQRLSDHFGLSATLKPADP